MKRRGTGWHMLLLPVLLGWAASPAAGAPADLRSIDWSRILSGLSDVIEARDASPTAEPISTATSVATPSRTSPGTATASLTPTDTVTPSRTPTSTPTHTASHTFAPPPTSTPPPTATPTNTATPTFTATDTPSPTHTEPPTSTQTPTFTRTPEPTPTTPAGQIGFVGAGGVPPAQRLASAFVVFPYVVSDADTDTRITLLNMTNDEQSLSCFYVRQSDCVEIGFFVRLTAQQPLSWLASEGTSNVLNFTAVPPFDGVGELKCAAMPRRPELRYHNVAHGRAIVFDRDESQTVAYGGIGFQRLAPGPFTGVISLDGSTYEQCPDRLHFQVLTRQGGSNSTLITVPCQQDLYTQVPTETVVQLAIISEFEQVFSSSFRFSCHDTRSFSQLSTLSKSVLGSDTAHVVARGVQSPIIGMVIDRFDGIDSHTAANNPFLEGGRASTVFFP